MTSQAPGPNVTAPHETRETRCEVPGEGTPALGGQRAAKLGVSWF